MMSIGQTSIGQENYYVQDYYQNGETLGQWLGAGALHLGLSGNVSRQVLSELWTGRSPDGHQELVRLVQRASSATRVPAWDLTVSAPKSVSVLWSQSESKVRNEIEQSLWSAAKAVVSYLQTDVKLARRGGGGRDREHAGLVVAAFAHQTSRRNDPQLHIHLLTTNVGVRADGTTGALADREIYRHKMAAGALFRTQLAYELKSRIGVQISPAAGESFSIDGVPTAACDALSTRRKEIRAAMKELGLKSARSAEMAALKTRRTKQAAYTRDQLFASWSHVAGKFGFTPAAAQNLIQPASDVRQNTNWPAVHGSRHIAELTRRNGHFADRDVVRSIAVEGQRYGWSAESVLKGKAVALTHRNVQRLGDSDRLSTKTHINLENKILARVDKLRIKPGHPVSSEIRQRIRGKYEMLSDEQKKAFTYLTKQSGAIKTVRGLPGTGKTLMLRSARDAWKAAGFKIVGVALSGKAAAELERGAKIKSQTFETLFQRLDAGRLYDRAVHVVEQFARAGSGKQTHKRDTLRLTSKTVVVVDEAAMATTRQLGRLVKQIDRAGASLVMVGDDRQLQSIESGGVFSAVHRKVGGVELNQIARQKHAWMRKAVVLASRGDARGALTAYATNGCLDLAKTREEARRSLVIDWNRHRTRPLRDTIIIAGRNQDVDRLNRMAQHLRYRRNELGTLKQRIPGSWIRRNDRVQVTRNLKKYGLRNGELATVQRIGLDTITLKMDTPGRLLGKQVPRLITLPKTQYQSLRLGYAISSHKSQGATFKKSFVLLNTDYQNRELSLVQLSRATDRTRLYSTKAEAGEDLAELSRAMAQSHRKSLAIEQGQDHRVNQHRNQGIQR